MELYQENLTDTENFDSNTALKFKFFGEVLANGTEGVHKNDYGHSPIFDKETSLLVEFILSGVLLTTVGLLGVLGNLLSISVLLQKKMQSSLSVLLISLSVCDMFVCILIIVIKGLPTIFTEFGIGVEYRAWICVAKKFIFPCLSTVQLGSTYFTVAITIERFIAVCHPLQSRAICTYKKARNAAIAIAIFSIIANIPMAATLFMREEVFDENFNCQSNPPLHIPNFLIHLRLTIYAVFTYFVPLMTVIVVNVIIIRKMRVNNVRRGSLSLYQTKEIKLTNMLIVVVAVYIFCNIFRVINSLTNNIYEVTYAELVSLTDFLVSFNSAINYLIYCAYGKSFRESFVISFCQCGRRRRSLADGRRTMHPNGVDANSISEMTMFESIRRLSKGFVNSISRSQQYTIRK